MANCIQFLVALTQLFFQQMTFVYSAEISGMRSMTTSWPGRSADIHLFLKRRFSSLLFVCLVFRSFFKSLLKSMFVHFYYFLFVKYVLQLSIIHIYPLGIAFHTSCCAVHRRKQQPLTFGGKNPKEYTTIQTAHFTNLHKKVLFNVSEFCIPCISL